MATALGNMVESELDTMFQVFFTVRLMMAAHFETGTMASPQHDSSRILNQLGLVSAMVDELGIVEWINRLFAQRQLLFNIGDNYSLTLAEWPPNSVTVSGAR